MLNPILRHGPLCDVEPEEVKLRLDSTRAPQRVLARDAANQLTNLFVDWWTANRRFRLPAPIETVSFSMPFDDRIGLNDDQRIPHPSIGLRGGPKRAYLADEASAV